MVNMDIVPLETHAYVHSPLIEYSTKGGYYTTYAIHLMSNHPAFTHPASHTRRRYSEFVELRKLLSSHYLTIKPPSLPPKKFFQRFNNEFIEERMKGLQIFLKQVLATPVYLSDKSLHLFLQSSSSMSKIYEECQGDIPAPQLMDIPAVNQTHSDSSSNRSSEFQEIQQLIKPLKNLILEDVQAPVETSSRSHPNGLTSKFRPPLSSSLRIRNSKQTVLPQKNGSVESSSPSSASSFDSSYCSSTESTKERKVSFNDKVQIAVVTNCGICVLTS